MTPPEAESALATAKATLAALDETYAARGRYDAGLAALGRQPAEVVETPAPTAPKGARPDIQAANAVMLRHAQAEGAREANRKALATANTAVAETIEAADTAEAEAERVTALLALARLAPTAEFARLIGSLPLPPEIIITAPEREHDKSPHLAVEVDGLPWEAASSGRRVWASLAIQGGIRAAATKRLDPSFRWTPIITDDWRLWCDGKGAPPQVDGPVWVCLSTEPGTPLEVRAGWPT